MQEVAQQGAWTVSRWPNQPLDSLTCPFSDRQTALQSRRFHGHVRRLLVPVPLRGVRGSQPPVLVLLHAKEDQVQDLGAGRSDHSPVQAEADSENEQKRTNEWLLIRLTRQVRELSCDLQAPDHLYLQ